MKAYWDNSTECRRETLLKDFDEHLEETKSNIQIMYVLWCLCSKMCKCSDNLDGCIFLCDCTIIMVLYAILKGSKVITHFNPRILTFSVIHFSRVFFTVMKMKPLARNDLKYRRLFCYDSVNTHAWFSNSLITMLWSLVLGASLWCPATWSLGGFNMFLSKFDVTSARGPNALPILVMASFPLYLQFLKSLAWRGGGGGPRVRRWQLCSIPSQHWR